MARVKDADYGYERRPEARGFFADWGAIDVNTYSPTPVNSGK